jgi:anti-sigma factor (TIGR02949 family)
MKGCDDYCSSIQLFLDEELSDQDLEECCAPLEGCPACRKELETEETLSHLLHRSRQLYSAPEALRARVRQTMADPLPATPHASMGLRDRVLKVLAQIITACEPSRLYWGSIGGYAASCYWRRVTLAAPVPKVTGDRLRRSGRFGML